MIRFDEATHSYFNEKGEKYLGVTSFVKMFSKPFDKEKIAKKYAKKHKKKVEEVIAEWDKASKDAINKGVAYHRIKETELTEKPHIIIEDEEYKIIKSSIDDGIKLSGSLKLDPNIYPELLVWSDKYKMAGQADYVEITKKGFINIKDYKTSKEIKMNGYEKWDGSKEMLKFPLHKFEDCNFSLYCLQINLYAFLIKLHNKDLKIGKLSIEHIIGDYDEEAGKFEVKDVVMYKVPNLQADVRVLLDYYKNTNK